MFAEFATEWLGETRIGKVLLRVLHVHPHCCCTLRALLLHCYYVTVTLLLHCLPSAEAVILISLFILQVDCTVNPIAKEKYNIQVIFSLPPPKAPLTPCPRSPSPFPRPPPPPTDIPRYTPPQSTPNTQAFPTLKLFVRGRVSTFAGASV
jgi:hypothetical protein